MDAVKAAKERATMHTSITTIGCDLGDKTSSLFLLNGDGTSKRHKLKTTPAAFTEWFAKLPAAHVVIEAGTHSHWVNQLVTELGHAVTVGNPRKVKLISQSDTKSDAKDPELLARLGRADTKLLSPIKHRNLDAQADLAVVRARDGLVETRTKLVNTCRGMVKPFGQRLPKCEANAFHKKAREQIPAQLAPALTPLLDALEAIEKAIAKHEAEIARLAKKYPDVEVIAQPTGVGVLTALTFLLTLEDKTRFKKSRMVGPYVGLSPRQSSSGDRNPQLGITHAGDGMLRRLLMQCAHYVLGPFGPDTDLKRWGTALAERGGKNAKKRATVATARKLAVLLHRLWVTGEEYEPLRNSSRRAATTEATNAA